MNTIDILLILPLIYAAWKGFRKGFIIELFMLLALLVGIYAGIHFSDWTSQLIIKNFEIEGRYLPVIAFTITFIGVAVLVYFIGKMLEQVVKIVQLGLVNRIFGLLFSIIKMVYILAIIIVLIESYDEKGNFVPQKTKENSALYFPIQNIATSTIPAVERSSIWLKNNMGSMFQEVEEKKKDYEKIKSIKEKADSLGVSDKIKN